MVKKTNTRRKRVTIKPRNVPKKTNKEMTLLGKALRSIGGIGGGALGGMIGMGPAGAAAGSSLGATISKWLGSGDYTVRSNSIVAGSVKASTGIPAMHKDGQSVIIRHKEYIGQLLSDQNFNVRYSLPINPGRAETFPWLANIAANFQEYSILGMVYHYIPSSGNAIAGTNNALGTIMFQTNYRATDIAATSKHEMLNEYWAGETVPSETLCHPIECDPKENPFNIQYIRTGDVPAGDTKLLYDLGTTFIAVAGQQANDIVLGDIWVTYEVELRKPVLYSNVLTGSDYVNKQIISASISPTDFFPVSGTYTQDGLLPINFVPGTRTIQIPIGGAGDYTFMLTLSSSAGCTDWTAASALSVLTNCSLVFGANFDTDNASILTTGTVVRNIFYVVVVRKIIKEVIATITFPTYTIGSGTVGACQFRVVRTSL